MALDIPVPAYIDAINAHLVAPNRGLSTVFTLHNNTRCTGDYHMGSEESVHDCVEACKGDQNCVAFTFCTAGGPEPSAGNCPQGSSCWKFNASSGLADCHTGNTGFISGYRNQTTIWMSQKNATLGSDSFSLYPLWPTETVNAIDTEAWDETSRRIAAASVRQWADFSGRPVLVFPAAVRGGRDFGGHPGEMADGVVGRSAEEIIDGLNTMLSNLEGPCPGRPYAAGGGTENVGVTQAVNDMLVQAPGGRYISLFPVWPNDQPASFQSLRTKGGFLVSAAYDAQAKTVKEGIVIVATAPDCTSVVLQNPWIKVTLVVVCDGTARKVAMHNGRASWAMRVGEKCVVSK